MNSVATTTETQNGSFDLVILQHAPYGIVACNSSGEITFANKLATFMLHEDSLTERNLLQIMEQFPVFKKGWDDLLTETQRRFAMPFSIENGTHDLSSDNNANLSLQATRFKNNSDKEYSILIFIEDLSSNETLDVADQLYTDSLEHLVDKKSKELESVHEQLISSEKKAAMIETAGAVAHELRQPMTTIIGTIELLNTNSEIRDNPKMEKRFGIIQKQCLRMADIIKQMERLVEYKTKQYVNGSLIIDFEESSQKK